MVAVACPSVRADPHKGVVLKQLLDLGRNDVASLHESLDEILPGSRREGHAGDVRDVPLEVLAGHEVVGHVLYCQSLHEQVRARLLVRFASTLHTLKLLVLCLHVPLPADGFRN